MEQSRKQVNKSPGRRILHSIVADPGVYQGDIAFVKYGVSPKLIKSNSGMTCMFILIEVASRYAYVTPMEDKSAASVIAAFNNLYGEIRDTDDETEFGPLPFFSLTTDEGKEFTNRAFEARLEALNINHFTTEVGDHFSLGIVDRFCRTLMPDKRGGRKKKTYLRIQPRVHLELHVLPRGMTTPTNQSMMNTPSPTIASFPRFAREVKKLANLFCHRVPSFERSWSMKSMSIGVI